MTSFVIDFANSAGSRWTTWIVVSLVESALLLGVVSLLWLAIRSRVAPQVGYLLFLLVPLKLLMPIGVSVTPALARWAPSVLIAAWAGTKPAASAPEMGAAQAHRIDLLEEARPASRAPATGATAQIEPPQGLEVANPIRQIATGSPVRVDRPPVAVTEPMHEQSASPLSVPAFSLLAWLTIVGSLAGRWALLQWRFGRTVRNLPEFDWTGHRLDLTRLCRHAGVRHTVRFVECDSLEIPAVWGIFHPTIIVPRQLSASLTTRQLRWLLLHELAHVSRSDLLVALFQRIVLILNFFNPAVWIANRVANRLREFACDDLASSLCDTSAVETGEAFLQIIQNAARSTLRLAGTLGLFGLDSRSGCLQRVERMLAADHPRPVTVSWTGWVAILLLAVLSLPYVHAAADKPPADDPGNSKPKATAPKPAPALQPKGQSDRNELAKGESAAEAGSFDLRIVGPDRKPIPNAVVQLRGGTRPEREQITVGTYDRKGPYGTFMKTDGEGRLVFKTPTLSGSFDLFIEQPGFGPYCGRWSFGENSEPIPARFTAELEAAWTVGGIVVDADGRPVEGVEVHPSIEFKKRPGDNKQFGSGARTKTDAEGKWRFECVPDSMSEVFAEISHPEFKPDRRSLTRAEFGIEPGNEAGAKVVLDRGLTVTGLITDDAGKPIAGALIRTKFLNDIRETRSKEDGTYRLGGCEPAQAKIVVSAKGRATDMKVVRVASDLLPVDFQMQRGGKVRVRVVDQKGQPIPKARIFFQHWRGDRFSYFEFNHVSQYADDKGVWEWNEAPLDEFKADICPPDGTTLNEQAIVARDEEYVFQTYPLLVVTGRVVDAETGKPIDKFQVLPGVRGDASHMNWVEGERFKGTSGKFTYRQHHGYFAHLIRVEASGYLPLVSRDIKSDEGEVAIDFELRKGKDVLAKVVDGKARPVEGASVVLGIAGSQISIKNGEIDSGSTYATQLKTDEAGKFRFPPQDKDFQLVITHPSGFAHIKSTPDWPNLRIIRLEPWARVEGTFQVGTKPVANVPVTINATNPHSYGKDVPSLFTHHDVTTGPNGEFVFERVFPGEASIGRRLMLTVENGATEATSGCMISAEFPGGKTTHFELGGTGRPVVGTLAPPDGFEGKVLWNFAMIDGVTVAADGDSPRVYINASAAPDGKFRIDDLPPGKYVLNVRFFEHSAGHLFGYQLVVPAIEGKRSDVPVDLGTLKLEKN